MSRTEYLWAPGEEPPLIQDHSLAKHEVLNQYLRTYVDVLTANPAMDAFKLTLIDGFAGGGAYTTTRGELHRGSPLQMVYAMEEASAIASARRAKKSFLLDTNFIFVEKEPRNNEVLAAVLQSDPVCRRLISENRIFHKPGTFEEHARSIVQHVRSRGRTGRSIFVLDQYGYTDVPLATIKNVLEQLPKAEVLLTFATDWLLDYMSNTSKGVGRERLGDMGLSGMEQNFDSILKGKGHKSPEWRRSAQSHLYLDLVRGSGAEFFTPFFIVSPRAHREYWFVHLSRHLRARDEMAKLHWALQNRFAHYGRWGLGMLGYDPTNDSQINQQQIFDFSASAQEEAFSRLSAEVPEWLGTRGGDGVPFLEFFKSVCNETPVTSDHLRDLIQSLTRVGELEVLDGETGSRRRDGVQLKDGDIVRCPRQLILDLGGRGPRK
jgi:three-Cys-motif partner protein